MLAIVLGFMLTVVVALGIMLVVAVPSMREGSRILTPEGERAVERARRQATAKPRAAAGSTWHGLVGLRSVAGRVWAPVSGALHEAFDRLESRESRESAERDAAAPIRHAAHPREARPEPAPAAVAAPETVEPVESTTIIEDAAAPAEPVRERFDVARVAGRRAQASAPSMKSILHDLTEPVTSPASAFNSVPEFGPVTRSSSVGRPRAVPPISGPIPKVTGPTARPGDREHVIDLRDDATDEADHPAGSARHAR